MTNTSLDERMFYLNKQDKKVLLVAFKLMFRTSLNYDSIVNEQNQDIKMVKIKKAFAFKFTLFGLKDIFEV